jgi:hypothetical protein
VQEYPCQDVRAVHCRVCQDELNGSINGFPDVVRLDFLSFSFGLLSICGLRRKAIRMDYALWRLLAPSLSAFVPR